jgi:hypothetical protein
MVVIVQKNMQICNMKVFLKKTKIIFFFIVNGVFACIFTSLQSQHVKFTSIKSLNVGEKHESLVKVMFTTKTEPYFYSTFKNVKFKRMLVGKVEARISKTDSTCQELTITATDEKQVKKLFKRVKHEFGAPNQKVFSSPTTFDWVWNDKKCIAYVESKTWHLVDANTAVFKIMLIRL